MKLGIIGALDVEVELLKQAMHNPLVVEYAKKTFFEGTILGLDVVVVQSGVGKVNAATCAQILVDKFGITALVNTGIAGSLADYIHIGDLVIATDAVQHDFNLTGFGYQPGEIPNVGVSIFTADEELRNFAKVAFEAQNLNCNIFEGRVLTGDEFIATNERKELIASVFSGVCCEMEGAAIAQVAWLNDLPFAIIRAISDNADDEDHDGAKNYDVFENETAQHCARALMSIIAMIQDQKTE